MYDTKTKRYIEWQDIHIACKRILKELKDSRFEAVAGIARGGMVPATVLSYNLEIPMKMLNISSFENGSRKTITDNTDKNTKEFIKNHRVLVVDDIFDTGQTIQYVREKYPTTFCVTLFDKRYEDPQNKFWYVFPWDKGFRQKVR